MRNPARRIPRGKQRKSSRISGMDSVMTTGSGKFDKYLSIAQQIAEQQKLEGEAKDISEKLVDLLKGEICL